MFERILNELQEKIRTRQYVMTTHAEEEMDDDGLSIFDVESVILSGEIIERQKDQNTGEWKYLVRGEALNRKIAIAVTKIALTGKLVFITVYRE